MSDPDDKTITDEEKLEKLYSRFSKFFNILDSDREGERAAALHKAWKAMQEINEIEARLYPENQRSNLKFATIFEKAAQGSVQADTPELADALTVNAALKESESIAIARLDRLEYLYREMKKKAYITLLKDGTVSRANVKAMEKYAADMTRTAQALDEAYRPVREALETFRTHAAASNGEEQESAAVADPLLILLHNALRKDLDFVRILEEGGTHTLNWKEKLARKLSKTPIDERDVALWRRLHAAQTSVIQQQQTVLAGMETLPVMLDELRNSIMLMEAERDMDAVPRAGHDKALEHLDKTLAELAESKTRQEKLETENATLTAVQEQLDQATAIVQQQEEEIEALQARRLRFIKHERAYGRAVRTRLKDAHTQIDRANETIAALQTGDLDNILNTLKKHGGLDKSERATLEKQIKKLETTNQQKEAELHILQDRIDIWVGEHGEQEQQVEKWRKRAMRNYGLGVAFALAAGAFALSGALPYVISDALATAPLRTALTTSVMIGAAGGFALSWFFAPPGKALRNILIGTFAGAAGMFVTAGLPLMILNDWIEKVQNQSSLPAKDFLNGINKPTPTMRQDGDKWIIEIPAPQPAAP